MRRFFSRFCCFFLPMAAIAQPALTTADKRIAATAPDSRAVIVRDDRSVKTFVPNRQIIIKMIRRGVTSVTGQKTPKEAWLSLVSTNDVVGIKVHSRSGSVSGTRRPVVAAVVEGLLEAGLPPRQIIVWDKRSSDLQAAGYFELADEYGIRVEGSADAGYDSEVSYETPLLGKLVWGDLEFGKEGEGVGRKSFVSKLITRDITRFISIAPLLNHYQAGVTGHIYGLALDSADNTLRFKSSVNHLKTATPELYAMEILGDRVALNIVDALICQYQGERQSLLHYSSILGELRFSRDPLALDVMSIRELEKQRRAAELPLEEPDMELYYNAGLLQIGQFDPKHVESQVIDLNESE